MPNIKSKSQLRLMQAILHGAKAQGGHEISKETAREVIGPKGTHYGKLPEKAKKKK
jgi:hypothetical protein